MSASEPRSGILCMAYGSPADQGSVAAYYTHIRGGHPPPADRLEQLAARYRAIGWSPLNQITREQATALGAQLEMPAFVGMKHAPPFIADAAAEARAAGIEHLIALPLAPHFARMSFGGYERPLREAWDGGLTFIAGFHTDPAFIDAVRLVLREALAEFEPEHVFFTAHSLPARIVAEGDDYPGRLLESCALVADGIDLPPWSFAFQSASATGEPWLGPSLLDALRDAKVRSALVCPIGFVADHLEILYDIDVEARRWGNGHGVDVRRTRSFNAEPAFIAALASVVRQAIGAPSPAL